MVDIVLIFLILILIILIAFLSYRCKEDKNRIDVEVRAAILNLEELVKHAKEIALSHGVSIKTRSSRKLLPRMEDNYKFIIKAYKDLNADLANRYPVAPAAEWLFDNFYIIEEQVKEIRLTFPKGYYSALPSLTSGSMAGFPRVYSLAIELISHTDGRIDEKVLMSFIKSYQSKSQLTSGEIWAIPIMLRIALIENIRVICEEILKSQDGRKSADKLVDMILSEQNENYDDAIEKINRFVSDMDVLNPSFAEHILLRLRKHGTEAGPIMHRLDELLASQDTTAEDIIQIEHQEQAKYQVSIGNSITGLRFVSTLEWNEIFEELSPVEQVLKEDPSNVYASMDFTSRDFYRHEIEVMAKSLKISESLVAKKAIECTLENEGSGDDRLRHVGYYITGKGRRKLEPMVGYKPDALKSIRRFVKDHPTSVYLWSIILIALAATLALTLYAYDRNIHNNDLLVVITALAVILPSSELAVGAVNWIVTHILSPSFLPKLELKEGIPEESTTMVVIPTLLPNINRVKELLEQLEVYYLANQDRKLYFALLGDFTDARDKVVPNDEEIIETALNGVKKLNNKYAGKDNEIFFFFHRYRKFNSSESKWLGWERKRGKLEEFNELLRGSEATTYYIKSGDISRIPEIKYVITLDADTELPRGAARRLIGTISHPLNKAVIDQNNSRVVDGYGILQPRVSIGITNANRSRFSRIFAGQGGLDPYTTAVSDVYQDLFGEGIYTGKGIYDVDVFIKVLGGYIPENSVLSHDLLEGAYTRAGLVTDIELVDGFPSKYSSYAARLHRWVRGDWQLLPWLMPRIKDSKGTLIKNPLSVISRWKIFDNMRRSLTAPALMVLIFLSLGILPGSTWVWLGFLVLTIALPVFADMADVILKSSRANSRSYTALAGFENVFYQIILMIIFLPYKAYLMIDAILRTLGRLMITKKNFLEWETAADAEARLKNDAKSCFTRMWVSLAAGAALFIVVLSFLPDFWPIAAIFVVAWILSPSIAYWISKNNDEKEIILSGSDIKELRRLFRKTWSFFEEFVCPVDNYLPPDNYQEEPPNGVAHRTSPTNIGLYLVTVLCARDMGYISTTGLLKRVENTLDTLGRLDMWKGHFYNWYDTRTLQPLRPLYVSTVDSGNFVGYLMVLKEGIREYMERPLVDTSLSSGLIDTIELFAEELNDEDREKAASLKEMLSPADTDVVKWSKTMDDLQQRINDLKNDTGAGKSPYIAKIDEMVQGLKDEMNEKMPWVELMKNTPFELENKASEYRDVNLKISSIIDRFNEAPTPAGLSEAYKDCLPVISDAVASASDGSESVKTWLKDFKSAVMKAYLDINKVLSTSKNLYERCQYIIDNTEFKPLFEEKRQLFSIGYSIEDEQLNRSYYDLLASEARMTSFISIAKGDIDQKHWFRLGRQLTLLKNYKGLVSWSGTMFEYLMPLLTMKNFKNTLMDETYDFVIRCQKAYGIQRHVPWGVSESGYYGFDMDFNYQYRAFGVPRLGLKRGLVNDMVIAPYATLMAVMVDPVSSMKNIYALKGHGLDGPYGLYEAMDFTPGRAAVEKKGAIVKSFMAHHHGMSILALDNFLNNNIIQERFHRDPRVKATELLLQEKVPGKILLTKDIEDEVSALEKTSKRTGDEYIKVIKDTILPFPEAHVVSNGSYSAVLTNSGTGFSKVSGTMINRWREDVSLDNYGMFFYIQNINSNVVWSSAYEPCRVKPDEYCVVFSPEKVEYARVDGNIDTRTEIVVSPEDSAEVRKISLTNHSDHSRVIEVTSYFEVVISPPSADVAHPAFNKLFVRTEFEPECSSLFAARRPRTPEDKNVWLFHTVTVEGETIGSLQYETDRARFIGRNRDVSNPAALDIDHPLSNTVGAVIDPVMSLRRRVRIKPGETVKISYTTGVADTRKGALALARKYFDASAVNRAFELAWTRSQVECDYLNMRNTEITLYQKMISHILYISPLRKKREDVIRRNIKGQSGLWPYGISGDIPIVLVSVKGSEEAEIVQDILKAHEYWRAKGLAVDLVILNEDESSYIQNLRNLLNDMVSSSHARDIQNRPGGVFVRQSGVMTPEERELLYSIARIVLRGDAGPITKQLKFKAEDTIYPEEKQFIRTSDIYPVQKEVLKDLQFYNGIGGFSKDGSEYVIQLDEDCVTPAPWSNVVANENFGFIVTESGSGYVWAENSREYKITPWSNDPVIDPPGEVIYLRDDEHGDIWSVTPQPVRGREPYTIRHGFGYSIFEHISHGIKQEMTVFVPSDERIKISRLKLKNLSGKTRKVSAVYYIRPVLGVSDQITASFITTEIDENSKVMLLKNTYSDDFPGRIVSVDCSMIDRSVTGDRVEFIGSSKSLKEPAALRREGLSGRVGAGYDPCAAMMVNFTLNENEEKEIVFTIGQGVRAEDVVPAALKYRNMEEVDKAYRDVKKYWEENLGAVRVNTPDKSLDIMVNGWLLYQTIASRLRARSAFYQSGGAYGFRDQLQDVMAVSYINPETTKNQILYSSEHQYVDGDVQHWWHPVTDRGIRTKFSDDLLWLPFVTADYIDVTGDKGILDIETGYLEDEPLGENEDERYSKPRISEFRGSIYEHCIRAIDRSLKFGERGIPLMGSGDWNDGMSSVGNRGKGESVWLGWFLYTILNKFVPICREREDFERADRYVKVAGEIVENIEKNAWDGSWYRRAYFDDGTPLGSASNTECQIDSLAQSWSIISGGGKQYRTIEAMGALEHYLVRKDDGIVMLLTPPFDKSSLEPGYIKGYVPGVRENGGQYTHAAVWVVMAFAMIGNGNRAWELYNMINPINHGRTTMEAARYKVEPYVMAADVYAVEPHIGRGGWTWYTGAAGWMYRVCIEYILGLKLRGENLIIDPCIPRAWGQYTMKYKYMDTNYLITVKNPNNQNLGVKTIVVDGVYRNSNTISLMNDGRDHRIEITL